MAASNGKWMTWTGPINPGPQPKLLGRYGLEQRLKIGEAYLLEKRNPRSSLDREGLCRVVGEKYNVAATTVYDCYKDYLKCKRWIEKFRAEGSSAGAPPIF